MEAMHVEMSGGRKWLVKGEKFDYTALTTFGVSALLGMT